VPDAPPTGFVGGPVFVNLPQTDSGDDDGADDGRGTDGNAADTGDTDDSGDGPARALPNTGAGAAAGVDRSGDLFYAATLLALAGGASYALRRPA
jgi:hypothetical protein